MIYQSEKSFGARVLSLFMSFMMVFSMFSMLTPFASLKTAAEDVDYATYVSGPYVIKNEYEGFGHQYLFDTMTGTLSDGAPGTWTWDGNANYGSVGRTIETSNTDGDKKTDPKYLWEIYSKNVGGNTYYMIRNVETGRYMHTGAFGDYYSMDNDNNSLNAYEWNATLTNGANGVNNASNANKHMSYYAFTLPSYTGSTGTDFTSQIVTQRWEWGNRPLHGELAGDHNTNTRRARVFFTSNNYGWGTKNWKFLTAPAIATGPAAPANLQATATSSTSVNLTWNTVAGTTYIVYRGTTDNAAELTQIGTATTNSYTDNNLTADTTYYYAVASTDGTDTSRKSTVVSVKTPEAAPVLAISGSSEKIDLSWTHSGALGTNYVIERSVDSGAYQTLTTTTNKAYSDTNIEAGKSYSYKVYAQKSAQEAFTVAAMSYTDRNGTDSFRQDTLQGDDLYNAGWIGNDTWAKYEINAQYTGTYSVKLYIAANNPTFTAYLNDENNKNTPLVALENEPSNNGWHNYKEFNVTLDLQAGVNNIYFVAGSDLNFWKMDYSINTTDKGLDSNVVNYSVADSRISAPTNVTATVNNGNIDLSWSAVDDATKYMVYRGTVINNVESYTLIGEPTGTTFTDTNTVTNATYYYVVVATDGTTTSDYSSVATAGIPAVVPVLSINGSDSEIGLSWVYGGNDSPTFVILRSTDNSTYSTLTETTQTSYSDTVLTPGNTYYYKVFVKNYQNDTTSNTVNYRVKDRVDAPTNLNVVAVGDDSANLTWTPSAGATKYEIYRSTVSDKYEEYRLVGETTSASFTDSGLHADTEYFYSVVAVKQTAVETVNARTNPFAVTTADEIIPVLSVTGSETQADVSWTYTGGEATFILERKAEGSSAWTEIYRGTSKAYTDNNVTLGDTYNYRVSAQKPRYELISVNATNHNETGAAEGQQYFFTQSGQDRKLDGVAVAGNVQTVGYVNNGYWAKYNVNVPVAGNYTVTAYVAAAANNLTAYLNDGNNTDTPWVSAVNQASYSNWQDYKRFYGQATLAEGDNAFYAVAGSSINLWKYDFEADIPTVGTASNEESFIATKHVAAPTNLNAVYDGTLATGFKNHKVGTPGDAKVTLTWNHAGGEGISYVIYRSTDATADKTGYSPIAVTTEKTYVDQEIYRGVGYTYKVIAVYGDADVFTVGGTTRYASKAYNSIENNTFNEDRWMADGRRNAGGTQSDTYAQYVVNPKYSGEYTMSLFISTNNANQHTPVLYAGEYNEALATNTVANLTKLADLPYTATDGDWHTYDKFDYDMTFAAGEQNISFYSADALNLWKMVYTHLPDYQSPESNTVDVKLPYLLSISNLEATPTTEAVTLTWAGVAQANRYDIYRSTTNNSASFEKINAENVTATTFTDTTAVPGTTYYYKVIAVDTDYNIHQNNTMIQESGDSNIVQTARLVKTFGNLFDNYTGDVYYINNNGEHRFGDQEPNSADYMGFNTRAFLYDSKSTTPLLKVGEDTANIIDGLKGGKLARKATYDNAGKTASYNYPEGNSDHTSEYFDNFKWQVVEYNGGFIFKNLATGRYIYDSANAISVTGDNYNVVGSDPVTTDNKYYPLYMVEDAPTSQNIDNYTFVLSEETVLSSSSPVSKFTNVATGRTITLKNTRNALHDTVYYSAATTDNADHRFRPAAASVPLTAPVLTATANGETAINVSWNNLAIDPSWTTKANGTTVVPVTLYVSTDGQNWGEGIDVTGETAHAYTGLTGSSKYYFKLVVSDGYLSKEVTTETRTSTAIPYLSIYNYTRDQIDLSWTYTGPANTSFTLYRSVNNGAYEAIATFIGNSYSDTNVAVDNTYKYKVSTNVGSSNVSRCQIVTLTFIDGTNGNISDNNGTVTAVSNDTNTQWYKIPAGTNAYGQNVYYYKNVSTGRYMHIGSTRLGSVDWYYYKVLTSTENPQTDAYKWVVIENPGQLGHELIINNANYTGATTVEDIDSDSLNGKLGNTFILTNFNQLEAEIYTDSPAPAVNCGLTTDVGGNVYHTSDEYVVQADAVNPDYSGTGAESATSNEVSQTLTAMPVPTLPEYLANGDDFKRGDFADFPLDSNISYVASNCATISGGAVTLNYTATSVFGEKFELDYSMTTPKYLLMKIKAATAGEETNLSISDAYEYSAAQANKVAFADLVTWNGEPISLTTQYQYVVIDIEASGLSFVKDDTHHTLSYDLWLLFSGEGSVTIDDIYFTNEVVEQVDSDDGIAITWPEFNDATSYKIYRAEATGTNFTQVGTSMNLTYNDATVEEGVDYLYYVVGTNISGDSLIALSPQVSMGLANPSNLKATPITTTSVEVSWNEVKDATSYNLYFSTNGQVWTLEQSGLTAVDGKVSYTDTGLGELTTYYYKVVSVNSEEESSGKAVSVVTPGVPRRPLTFLAKSAGSTKINLTWTDDYSLVNKAYAIYRSTNSDMSGKVLISDTLTGSSYLDEGLNPETTYYYQIYSVNSVGDYSPTYRNSSATTTGYAEAPDSLTATASSSSVINLLWSEGVNADSYDIFISTDGQSFTRLASNVRDTSYSVIKLDAETKYYFRVYSNTVQGEQSDDFASANATTTAPANTKVIDLEDVTCDYSVKEYYTATATVRNDGLGVQDQTYVVTFILNNGITEIQQNVVVTEDLAPGQTKVVTTSFVSPTFNGEYDISAVITASGAEPVSATLTCINGFAPDTDPEVPGEEGNEPTHPSEPTFTPPTYTGLTYEGGPYYIYNSHYKNNYLYDGTENSTLTEETQYGSDSDGTAYSNAGHLLRLNGNSTNVNAGTVFADSVEDNEEYMWLIYSKSVGGTTYYVLVNYGTGRAIHTGVYKDYYSNNGGNNSANTYAWNEALANVSSIGNTDNTTKELSYYMHSLPGINLNADTFTSRINNNRWIWGGRPLHAEHNNANGYTFYTDNDYGWGTKSWIFDKAEGVTSGPSVPEIPSTDGVDLEITEITAQVDGVDFERNVNVGDTITFNTTITNNGTTTLPAGTKIEVKYLLGYEIQRATLTLAQDLATDGTATVAVSFTVSRTLEGVYPVATVNPKYGTAASELGDLITETNYANNTMTYNKYVSAVDTVQENLSIGELSLTYNEYTDTYTQANPLYINEGESIVATVPITNTGDEVCYNVLVAFKIGDVVVDQIISIAPGETIGVPVAITPEAANQAQRISAIVSHNGQDLAGNATSFVFVAPVHDLSIVSIAPDKAYTGYALSFMVEVADNSSAPYTGNISAKFYFDKNNDGDYNDEGEVFTKTGYMDKGEAQVIVDVVPMLDVSDVGFYKYLVEVTPLEGEKITTNNVSNETEFLVYDSTVTPFTIRNRYNFGSINKASDGTGKYNLYIYDNVYATNAATHDAALVRFAGATTPEVNISTYQNASWYNVNDAVTNGHMYTTVENGPNIEDNPEFYWYYETATGGIRNYATGAYLTRGTEEYIGTHGENKYSTIRTTLLTPTFVKNDSEWFYYRDPYYTYTYTAASGQTVTDGNYFIVASPVSGINLGDIISTNKGIFENTKVLSLEYAWDGNNYDDVNNTGEGVVNKATFVDNMPNAIDGANKYWVQYEGPTWYLDFEAAKPSGGGGDIERKTYEVKASTVTKSNTVGSGEASQRQVSLAGGQAEILDPIPQNGIAVVQAGGSVTISAKNVLGYKFQGWYGYKTDDLTNGVLTNADIPTIMDDTSGVGGSSIYYLGNDPTLTVNELYYNYTIIGYFERTIYNVRLDVDINSNYSLSSLTPQQLAQYSLDVYDPTTGSHKSAWEIVKMNDKYLQGNYTGKAYYPLNEPVGYIEKAGDHDYVTSTAVDEDIIYDYPMGSQVTLNAIYDKTALKFIGWKDMLSNVLVSTEETYSFNVGTNIYLMALYADADSAVDAAVAGTGTTKDNYISVYYVDQKTRKVHYVDKSLALTGGTTAYGSVNPALVGYDFIGWFHDEEATQAVDFTNDVFTHNTIVYGCYEKKAERYDINVLNHDGRGGTRVLADNEFNKAFRITATEQDQFYQNFSYWEYGPEGGAMRIISTNPVVEVITLMANSTLRAVYGAPAGSYSVQPFTNTTAVYQQGTTLWATCTRNVDTSKYTLVEKGVIIMTKLHGSAKPTDEDFFLERYLQPLDENGCGVIRGRSGSTYTMYSLRKTGINTNLDHWVRAYMICGNNETGEVKTYYGTILEPKVVE